VDFSVIQNFILSAFHLPIEMGRIPGGILKKCHNCGASLWRPATKIHDKDAKSNRWYISRILKKDFTKYFDLYVSDEVHEQKAADSGRGDALGQIARSAKKVLGLTGTLTNGASTSIKEILFRIAPYELLKRGFDRSTGTIQWAANYGVLEKITKTSTEDRGVITRRKAPRLQVREKPGISPRLTVEYLLGSTVFLELPDLGLPLVEKKEIPIFVEMDANHKKEYKQFHQSLMNACRQRRNFGPFIPATINYGDRPDLGGIATFNYFHNGNLMQNTISAPKIPGFNAKERKLVELVNQELLENRGVVIYVSYTDKYQIHKRLKGVLSHYGIDAEILPSSVSPSKRVEWLKKKEEQGTKVIISNMRLVSTGIDLLPWPTLIFYQLNYDCNTVRQAAGRSWRVGQYRECRIYYLIMNETQQVSQLERVMSRRGHAMLVEGKIEKSELAKYSRDAHFALASDIANCIASQDLGKSWQELARKDNVGVKMVSEDRYQEVVKKAMLELGRETRKLCGLPADDVRSTTTWNPDGFKIVVVDRKQIKNKGRKKPTEGQLMLSLSA